VFDLIGLDADDTLWHNEPLYEDVQEKLADLLADYAGREVVKARLYEKEMGNLQLYGFGIKSFTLSMIETAIELTEGGISGRETLQIIAFAREMLTSEVHLLEHAAEAVRELSQTQELMIITKGDLRDQESKLRRSGLAEHFRYVEVVSDKVQATYARLLAAYRVPPQRFLMVGNSVKSDVLPVLALGGHAVYIPYQLTWVYETAAGGAVEQDGYYELEHIGQLPELVRSLG